MKLFGILLGQSRVQFPFLGEGPVRLQRRVVRAMYGKHVLFKYRGIQMISETLGLPFRTMNTEVTITGVDPVVLSSKPYLPQQNTLHSILEDG